MPTMRVKRKAGAASVFPVPTVTGEHTSFLRECAAEKRAEASRMAAMRGPFAELERWAECLDEAAAFIECAIQGEGVALLAEGEADATPAVSVRRPSPTGA